MCVDDKQAWAYVQEGGNTAQGLCWRGELALEGAHHKEMNAQVYEEWFAKVLDWIKDKYVSLPFPFVDCAW